MATALSLGRDPLLLRSIEGVRTKTGEWEGGELDEKKNKGSSLNFEKGCHPNPP